MGSVFRVLIALLIAAPAMADEWTISRVYQSSPDYWRVVVAGPSERVMMSCALTDANDDYIAQARQMVRGPVDEVLIRNPGARAHSARCWIER